MTLSIQKQLNDRLFEREMALLFVYTLHKDQFTFYRNIERVWEKIAEDMNEKFPEYKCTPGQCRARVLSMKKEYESLKHMNSKTITSQKDAIFLKEAKLAFETKENPVAAVPNKVKVALSMQKQLNDRLFERDIALLFVYTLHKGEFTIHRNVERIWEKIAEKMNENFPKYKCTAGQCRARVLSMKTEYESLKHTNTKALTSQKDAIFLKEAKLAFETKENPVTFIDDHKKEKLLAPLKAFNMYKVQFLSPDADQEELWQKITEAEQKLSLQNKPYSVADMRNHMCFLKSKYDKLKNSKTDITTPEDGIFFEEAELVFESSGSEAISVDQILHDGHSEQEKFERRLALLRAYNIYKAEFSSPSENDESVWEKIAGTVRISCSLTHWTINDCRLQLSQMKKKYEKKKRDGYRPKADILFEEEELAFETIIYPEEHELMDLLTEINSNGF